MQRLLKFFSNNLFIWLVILISLPTFYRMVRPGIYSTQDFHFFRLVEFDKCVRDLQIPCRWAPDAGFGFGEPLFNFYGQVPYALGEIFHLTGVSRVDSLKLVFILSLAGSAMTMFFLAKKLWGDNLSAIVSSIVYVYAPYRAVDVWVRGALPEALAFVIFPLVILSIERGNRLWFSFWLAALVLTHNLSLVLFLPILLVWILYRRAWKMIPAGIGAASIAAFYILPVIFEAKYITLENTTRGYFDFRGHFATIKQLLFSRYWGYGASVFGPDDGLNLSVGILQWAVPSAALALVVLKRKVDEYKFLVLLVLLGWFSLFLTHNKSTFIWELLPTAAYLQFPWRFLGVAVFVFSLGSGAVIKIFEKYKVLTSSVVILGAIFLNFSFFREDIWYNVKDSDLISGERWEEQTVASIGDFWPKFGGDIPTSPAQEDPENGSLIKKNSHLAVYEVVSQGDEIEFPLAYFPGWNGYPSKNGLIAVKLPKGEHLVTFKFSNTPVRTLGNIISLVSILGLGILGYAYKK